jgi:hypothetical protein
MLCEFTSAKHAILYEITSTKHAILYEIMSAKHAWVSLEKIRMGANGQTAGKNSSNTFVLTAFISFGLFNIFGRSRREDAPPEKSVINMI